MRHQIWRGGREAHLPLIDSQVSRVIDTRLVVSVSPPKDTPCGLAKSRKGEAGREAGRSRRGRPARTLVTSSMLEEDYAEQEDKTHSGRERREEEVAAFSVRPLVRPSLPCSSARSTRPLRHGRARRGRGGLHGRAVLRGRAARALLPRGRRALRHPSRHAGGLGTWLPRGRRCADSGLAPARLRQGRRRGGPTRARPRPPCACPPATASLTR